MSLVDPSRTAPDTPLGVIDGSRGLPPGFDHPHSSEEAREIAERGMILRVQVGSGVHGTSVSGQDDRDEMGICLEPSAFVTGLARVPNGVQGEGSRLRFEQYERHTAWDKPGGLANRSGAGDLDVIVYSARKWAQLALAGNPTVLLVLFVPDKEVVFRNRVGAELVNNAHRFVSRLVADRFLGYLQSQKAALVTRTPTVAPSTAAQPPPSWLLVASGTRQPTTRVRSRRLRCCPTAACSAATAGDMAPTARRSA
jgi:uncharacterized protein